MLSFFPNLFSELGIHYWTGLKAPVGLVLLKYEITVKGVCLVEE